MTTDTSVKTRSKTGLIVGIVAGVAALAGIGFAIWNFAVAPTFSSEYINESFGKVDHMNLKKEALNIRDSSDRDDKLILPSTDKSFSNREQNNICPKQLKDAIDTVELYVDSEALQHSSDPDYQNYYHINTSDLSNNATKFENFIKLKINGNNVDLNSSTFNLKGSNIDLKTLIKNKPDVKLSDLVRWVTDPTKLIVQNNGSVWPVMPGAAGVFMNLCDKSNTDVLNIVIDVNPGQNVSQPTEKYTFDNTTTAGIGTTKSFFANKYTNRLVTSKDYIGEISGSISSDNIINTLAGKIKNENNVIKNVEGFLKYNDDQVIKSQVQLYFSFDDGESWNFVPISNTKTTDGFSFSYNVPDDSLLKSKKLKWAVAYQYNKDISKSLPNVVKSKPLLGGEEVKGIFYTPGNNTDGLAQNKVLFLNQNNVSSNIEFQNDYTRITDQELARHAYNAELYDDFLMSPFASKEPGISNYQKENYIAGGDFELRSIAVVTLPSDLILTNLKFKVATTSATATTPTPVGQAATITATPTSCDKAPCEVQFGIKEGSINSASYGWVFGDQQGSASFTNLKSPKHTYENPGVYNAKLTFLGNSPISSNTIQINVAESTSDGENVGDQVDPGTQNPSDIETDTTGMQGLPNVSVTATNIFRGSDRVIVKILGNDDNSKNEVKTAFDAKTLTFKYGTDKNNLNKEAEVRYDDKANQYYVVLRKLEGGEKQGFNDNGFTDGRMKYYYRFMVGDKGLYVDSNKTTTLASFKTLNRMRTVLYYYNWIFDRNYDLTKDYDWNKEQNGGVKFWYDTNLSLPGIRFAMINDRKFKVFDETLDKKKKNMNLVTWLYKKILDRIYDDNLYKFAGEGADFWLSQMTDIAEADRLNKSAVKYGISVSNEYRDQLAEMAASENEAQAEFAYIVVLKRAGDKNGVKYLMDTFDSQLGMRENLFNSQEYNQRLIDIEKASGKKGAITELYETIYARPADKAGVDYWDSTGQSIPEIKAEFLNSDEFRTAASE
ncbi:MAG: PKD domain-containing protein [Patescibacteria group bacterium]|jgi:hypothetical protein